MRILSNAANRLDGQRMFQILALTQKLEAKGKKILHFELGDPDFCTPRHIIKATTKALSLDDTHYAPSTGLLELKEAVAESTLQTKGFRPDINQLLVTAGANVQLFYAIACTVNPGDDVIVPDPAFVSYFSILKYLGVNIIRVPLKEENEFRLDPKDVRKVVTPKTRMIIINSPSNPTGTVMSEDEIREIYEIAEEYDLYLLSDEVYGRIIYGDAESKKHSPSEYDKCKKRVILVNSFSKSYVMPGFRLGVIMAPDLVVTKMGLLLETTSSCVSPFIQRAGIAALMGDQKSIIRTILESRRNALVNGLNSLPGVSCILPKGAFYAFPNIKKTGLSSNEFTELVLNEAGVAVVPGNVFGEYGEGYVRFAYTTSMENIYEAIRLLGRVLKNSH